MDCTRAINQLYLDLTLNELRLMNENTLYPNISYNSLLYLDLIANQEGCTVSTLAKALHISKSAVTLKVNELMHQGLVKKTQSSLDRRVNYLTVSDPVREDYRGYDRRLSRAVAALEGLYSQEQMQTFVAMIDAFRKEYIKEP